MLLSQVADLGRDGGAAEPGAPAGPFDPRAVEPPFGAWFTETINGYACGHAPGLRARRGQAYWYVMGSTNVELHATCRRT